MPPAVKRQRKQNQLAPPPAQRRKHAQAAPPSPESEDGDVQQTLQHDGDDGDDSSSSGGGSDSFPEVSSTDEADGTEDSEQDEDGLEDDTEALKEITVEFDFFPPQEKDFLGLRTLLATYVHAPGEQFDVSGMVDAIIEQGEVVGSVVKTDEDDDPIAVLSVLNLEEHAEAPFLRHLRAWLDARCPAALRTQLAAAFTDAPATTGLLVNERLLNAPPKLAPPLLQFTMAEVADAATSGEPYAHYFALKRYLLATRVYLDTAERGQGNDEPQTGSAAPVKSQALKTAGLPAVGGLSAAQQGRLVYVRPEDEFLHSRASWSFVFPVEGRPVAKDGLVAHRLVMLVDAGVLPAVQTDLDAVVGNMAAAGSVQQAGTSGRKRAAGRDAGDAGPSGGEPKTLEDVQRMASAVFAQAAAAGAGKGAARPSGGSGGGGGGGGKKQKGKQKDKKQPQFRAKATQL